MRYTFLTAAILLSIVTYSQTYYSNNTVANNNVSYAVNSPFNNKAVTQMAVIGNPARNAITLQISNPVPTKYELSLYSSNGQKVSAMLYEHPAGVSTKTIYVSQLEHGMYYLVAVSKSERKSINILVQ